MDPIAKKTQILLEWNGWTKSTKALYHPEYGETNLLSAVLAACEYNIDDYKKYCLLLCETLGVKSVIDIVKWETRHDRTVDDLNKLLQKL